MFPVRCVTYLPGLYRPAPNKPLERAGVTRYGESSGWRAGRSAPGLYTD
jgi:hypothetical protein